MPINPLDFLKSSFKAPAEDPAKRATHDKEVKRLQSLGSPLKKAVRIGIDSLMDFGKGALGFDAGEGPTGASQTNLAGQMISAGLPIVGGLRGLPSENSYRAVQGLKNFYSRLTHGMETQLPNEASAERIMKMAGQMTHPDEIKLRGMDQWAKTLPRQIPIPKREVLEYLDDNPIKMVQHNLSGRDAQYFPSRLDVVPGVKSENYTERIIGMPPGDPLDPRTFKSPHYSGRVEGNNQIAWTKEADFRLPDADGVSNSGPLGRVVGELQSDAHQIARDEARGATNYGVEPDDSLPFKETYPRLMLKNFLINAAERPDLDWVGIVGPELAAQIQGHGAIKPGIRQYYGQAYPDVLGKLLKQHDSPYPRAMQSLREVPKGKYYGVDQHIPEVDDSLINEVIDHSTGEPLVSALPRVTSLDRPPYPGVEVQEQYRRSVNNAYQLLKHLKQRDIQLAPDFKARLATQPFPSHVRNSINLKGFPIF